MHIYIYIYVLIYIYIERERERENNPDPASLLAKPTFHFSTFLNKHPIPASISSKLFCWNSIA